jgi:hypothetical protein
MNCWDPSSDRYSGWGQRSVEPGSVRRVLRVAVVLLVAELIAFALGRWTA